MKQSRILHMFEIASKPGQTLCQPATENDGAAKFHWAWQPHARESPGQKLAIEQGHDKEGIDQQCRIMAAHKTKYGDKAAHDQEDIEHLAHRYSYPS